jgi:glucose/arabinose dehydrogenase
MLRALFGWLCRPHTPARPTGRHRPAVEPLEDRSLPAPVLPAGFQDTQILVGLPQTTGITFAPDGRLFITEKAGDVRIFENGQLLPTPFLHVNVSTKIERGLESIAFDPNFATNGFVYVYYSAAGHGRVVNRVSRFHVSPATPDVVDPGSETIMLNNIPTPTGMHNGGGLHFGSDGMLYVSVGDGGNKKTPQNLGSLNGKILRLNVAAFPNIIPPDNPFVHRRGARKEIWALGFRNPFTFSPVPGSNALMVNDVGDAKKEEVDLVKKGRNYGWPILEGPGAVFGLTNPLYSYRHVMEHGEPEGAITGSTFYPGTGLGSTFQGAYFFGDFDLGFIKALTPPNFEHAVPLVTHASAPISLAVGPDGALYYLAFADGSVHKITFGT